MQRTGGPWDWEVTVKKRVAESGFTRSKVNQIPVGAEKNRGENEGKKTSVHLEKAIVKKKM